jgi:hypothetical protein
MKRLVVPILLAFCILAARAEDWLQNGDFSSNADHWYGEARWPADFAPPDPFTKADPFTSQGMIIQLKDQAWVKEFQDFKGKGTNATLRITFTLAPGTKFGNKPEDMQNVPNKIGWNAWKPFDTAPDSWVIIITEVHQEHGEYQIVSPDMNSTQDQTMSMVINGMTPWSQKTIALAFPPGTGTIVIHKIELIDPDAPASP